VVYNSLISWRNWESGGPNLFITFLVCITPYLFILRIMVGVNCLSSCHYVFVYFFVNLGRLLIQMSM
jgi:hypothetical protein